MTFSFSIKHLPGVSALVFLLVLLSLALPSCAKTPHHLSFIPDDMEVQKVLYSEEKLWGFGPGGNETGVIVYELPSSTVERIKDIGIDYFLALSTQTSADVQDWRGMYAQWHLTPIARADKMWFKIPASDETTSVPTLDNYLTRYGFDIPIEPEIETMVDKIISTPGSFYAYGRGRGVIVVAPDVYRVFYVYSG